jgi:hypothetical protein
LSPVSKLEGIGGPLSLPGLIFAPQSLSDFRQLNKNQDWRGFTVLPSGSTSGRS